MLKSKALSILFTLFAAIVLISCGKDTVVNTTTSGLDYNALFVVNGGSNSISVIDISNNQVKKTIAISGITWPHHIYMNPAKTKLAIAIPGMDFSQGHHGGMPGMLGRLIVMDAVTDSILTSTVTPSMNHNAIFSPDGSEIWTALMQDVGLIYVYNANNYALKDSISVGMMPAEITFSSDNSMAFVANGMGNDITIIDAHNKNIMGTVNVGNNPVGAWTGANNKMYVDNEDGHSISVINVSTMLVEETVNLGFMPGMSAYNSQKTELWVTNSDSGKVAYFQRMNNMWMNMGNISTGAGAHAVAFSSDGNTAYITNQMAGTVSVVDVITKTKTTDIAVGVKPNGMVIRYK